MKRLSKVFSLALSAFFLTLSAQLAQARPAGARGDNFVYIMQSGDTLGSVAEKFTSTPSHWRQIKALNNIALDENIPVGKELLIPFKYIDTFPSQTTVISLEGKVTIDGQVADASSIVRERARIETAADGAITLQLGNKDIIAIAPDSIIVVQRLRQFSGTALIDAIFKTEKGEFSTQVNSSKVGIGRFEIRTPVSITGIRGTTVRNRIDDSGNAVMELISGKADVSRPKNPMQATKVNPEQGVVVSKKGKMLRDQLPDAPTFEAVPDTSSLNISVSNQNENIASYLIRYTKDEQGWTEIARFRSEQASMQFPLPNSSRFYVQVRAIGSNGLSSKDASELIYIAQETETDSSAGGSRISPSKASNPVNRRQFEGNGSQETPSPASSGVSSKIH